MVIFIHTSCPKLPPAQAVRIPIMADDAIAMMVFNHFFPDFATY